LTDAAFPAPPKLDVQRDASKPFPTSSATKNHDLQESPLVIKELLILDVSGCSLITDDAIEGVVSHAPKLQLVFLSRLGSTVARVESICHKLNRETPRFYTLETTLRKKDKKVNRLGGIIILYY
jgi:F-box and leucine-rich repeat protein GRR1